MCNNVFSLFAPESAHSHSTHTDAVTVNFTVGDRVTLPCKPALKDGVVWAYHSSSSTKPLLHVVNDGIISNEFISRFSLSILDDGHYNLVITHGEQSDAGLYICMEDGGERRSHYVYLARIGNMLNVITT